METVVIGLWMLVTGLLLGGAAGTSKKIVIKPVKTVLADTYNRPCIGAAQKDCNNKGE